MLTKHWYLVDLAGLLGSQSKFVALAKHKYFISCHLRLTNYWLFVTTGVDQKIDVLMFSWCLLEVFIDKRLMLDVFCFHVDKLLIFCWWTVDVLLMFKKVLIFCILPFCFRSTQISKHNRNRTFDPKIPRPLYTVIPFQS